MCYLNIENVYFKCPKGNKRGRELLVAVMSPVILVQISLSNQKHLLSRTMCRELFIIFGISEMVMIFTILQALGISNKNTTEDINSINIRLRREYPMSLEKEDCSHMIVLLEFILFALILVWLVLVIYLIRYINRN